jgi:DmsE family decaheme c-type cytochrome
MAPKAVLDACLACHSLELTRANIHRSPHTLAGTVCTNCHSIHRSPVPRYLLARKQADLCLSCHAPVRAQFSMPVKHRVLEGAMVCTDCHNPHGVPAPGWGMSVRAHLGDHVLGNEQACLKCHSDKRGPFAFEHPAVRVNGCTSCHVPHGSMNTRLLRRPVVFTVCLECHNGAGTFGRQADGITLPSATHNLADPRYRDCTTCHAKIHGSNADPLFLR